MASKELLVNSVVEPLVAVYDDEVKTCCGDILRLEDDIVGQEPHISFGAVVNTKPQWWIKPDSSSRKRGRCVTIKWDTPAQKLFKEALIEAYQRYNNAYLLAVGGHDYEAECDGLKVQVKTMIDAHMVRLATKYRFSVEYFCKLYKALQVRLEKSTDGRYVQWRTTAVAVPEKLLEETTRQVRAKNYRDRVLYPYCIFCRWIGHTRDTCDEYAKAPTCEYCNMKGHRMERCRKAPVCENCLEKGHIENKCDNESRCRFCNGSGHVVQECEKLKKMKCHRCGRHGHTASRCFDGMTFDDDEEVV